MSRALMILGTLGMLLAVAMSAEVLGSYVRHMDSGDQAGFALGVLFVIGYVAPIAAALLTIGAVPVRMREQGAGGAQRPERWIAVPLMILGALMAVFTVLYAMDLFTAVTSRAAQFPLPLSGILFYGTYAAALAALVCNVLGLAVALWVGPLRPRDGGPGWLGPLLAVLAPFPFLSFVALLINHVPSMGALWAVALGWAAYTLRRIDRTVPQDHADPATPSSS